MIRLPSNVIRDDDGAAIIELALVAPVLALMTIGIVDISNGFSRKLQLEQGVQRSVEKVMQTTGVLSVESTIANEVVCQVNGTNDDGTCKTAPITTANVTVTHRLECDGVVSTTDSDSDGEIDCPEEDDVENRWIQVSVWSDYEPVFNFRFAGMESNGKYRLVATAGMRTK
jgi:Flp pilus assembly protein TadG